MQTRRLIAAAVIGVLLILIVFGVKSCQDSAHDSAMRSFAEQAANIINRSQSTSGRFFSTLSSGGGSGAAQSLQTQVDQDRADAAAELASGRNLSAPTELEPAHRNLVLALQMRSDGIADAAKNIQPALGNVTNRDGLAALAADTARFYASDVVYKVYAAPEIVAALHAAGIPVGGQNGEPVSAGQFLPDLSWLNSAFIAAKLGSSSTPKSTKVAPGLHGHTLNSVSVNGTQLQAGSSNSVSRSPTPSFTVNFTNGGTNAETNVAVKVVVSGTGLQGQTIVPQTSPGQSVNAVVKLPSVPAAGTYTVTVSVAPVPGEKNVANNSQAFPVTFG